MNKEIIAKYEAQKKFCKQNNGPLFCPVNGHCHYCGRNIFEEKTLESASSELITGCPYCGHSYCE